MQMKSFAVWLFVISLAILDRQARTETVKLEVQTRECTKGVPMKPARVSVAVFDPEKISGIVELALSYERSASRINEDGADKAESKFVELRQRVESAKALAHAKHLSARTVDFALPAVGQIVIFGFGETPSDFRYARRVMDLIPGRMNDVILNFSSDEECRNAK